MEGRIIVISEEEKDKAIAELTNRLLKGEDPKIRCEYNHASGLYEPKPLFGWGQ
jgi:hypothetical protein